MEQKFVTYIASVYWFLRGKETFKESTNVCKSYIVSMNKTMIVSDAANSLELICFAGAFGEVA